MKRTIRLTESELRNIIRKTINEALRVDELDWRTYANAARKEKSNPKRRAEFDKAAGYNFMDKWYRNMIGHPWANSKDPNAKNPRKYEFYDTSMEFKTDDDTQYARLELIPGSNDTCDCDKTDYNVYQRSKNPQDNFQSEDMTYGQSVADLETYFNDGSKYDKDKGWYNPGENMNYYNKMRKLKNYTKGVESI